MHPTLVEHTEDGKKAHKSLILEPDKLAVLNSKFALDIVREMIRKPSCALDIARSLHLDEQKVYYYLKKLEQAGIVKLIRMERRHGMTAKIYGVLAPVIATKLHDDGQLLANQTMKGKDIEILNFLSPFIKEGKLNSLIIIGDPYSHGRFDKSSHEGPFVFDFGILLGKLIDELDFPHFKLDTEVQKEELSQNLILVGNIKSNVVIDKLNDKMPIYFDTEKDFKVCSRFTGNGYKDPRVGVVMKFTNPFNKKSKILIVGGMGSRGTRSSVIAFTERFDDIVKSDENGDVFRIVKGYASSGDRVIDAVEILE